MPHHFTTERLGIFQSMIASAIREGLTFEAFEEKKTASHIEYVINYTGGHG
tara:strand:- start:288 stop:440 length:153 start_codon:yes stop_codon:yes gene_type:complete